MINIDTIDNPTSRKDLCNTGPSTSKERKRKMMKYIMLTVSFVCVFSFKGMAQISLFPPVSPILPIPQLPPSNPNWEFITLNGSNTFVGTESGQNNQALYNTFYGSSSGYANTTGGANTFIGWGSGHQNSTGQRNTFTGHFSGQGNNGSYNTFYGFRTGGRNSTGDANTYIGYQAGFENNTGSGNTYVGFTSGYAKQSGSNNTFYGYESGRNNIAGSGNVFIGYRAGQNESGSGKLYITNSDDTTPLIHGDFSNDELTVNGELDVVGTVEATSFIGDGSRLTNLPGEGRIFYDNEDVGIGTTSPKAKLDVAQQAQDSFSALRLRAGNSSNYPAANQVLFSWNGEPYYTHVIKTRHNSAADDGNAIDFYLWDQGTDNLHDVGTKHVMSLNGGKVGIGTTSPSEALDVVGNVEATSFIGDGSQLTNLPDPGEGTVHYINGNVGIGTENPQEKLHLTDVGPVELRIEPGGGQIGSLRFKEGGFGDQMGFKFLTANSGDNNKLQVFANVHSDPEEKIHMTILEQSGNVGIGATSPEEKLDVAGNVQATSFIGDGSQLTNLPDPGEGIVHYIDGNVGIGTSNPTSRLAVNGGVTATQFFGDGSLLTGITGSQVNITGNDINSGTIGGSTAIDVTSNIETSANVIGDEIQANEVKGANLSAFDQDNNSTFQVDGATGQVSATSFTGDGSQLSGVLTAVSGDDITTGTISGDTEINTTGDVIASKFIGDGSSLTGITGSQVNITGNDINSGTIGGSTAIDVTSNIETSANVIGDEIQANEVKGANLSAFDQDNNSTFQVDGATGQVSATSFTGDGSQLSGVLTAVSGDDITTGTISGDTQINTTGDIRATNFYGDGSGLTNLPGEGKSTTIARAMSVLVPTTHKKSWK